MEYRHLPPGREPGELTSDWGELEDPAGGFFVPGDLAAAGRALKGLFRGRRADGQLELELAATEFRRGDVVQATVRVEGPETDPIPAVGSLVCAGAFWFSKSSGEGRHAPARHEIELARYTTEIGSITHGRTIQLALPRDGPYSYEGIGIAHAWRIEARETDGRRFGWRPIWVLP
jgi:hypothetical protein